MVTERGGGRVVPEETFMALRTTDVNQEDKQGGREGRGGGSAACVCVCVCVCVCSQINIEVTVTLTSPHYPSFLPSHSSSPPLPTLCVCMCGEHIFYKQIRINYQFSRSVTNTSRSRHAPLSSSWPANRKGASSISIAVTADGWIPPVSEVLENNVTSTFMSLFASISAIPPATVADMCLRAVWSREIVSCHTLAEGEEEDTSKLSSSRLSTRVE